MEVWRMAGGSRFQQKQQKRRQNGVLNIAIAIVLLLVAIVDINCSFLVRKSKHLLLIRKSLNKQQRMRKLENQKIKNLLRKRKRTRASRS